MITKYLNIVLGAMVLGLVAWALMPLSLEQALVVEKLPVQLEDIREKVSAPAPLRGGSGGKGDTLTRQGVLYWTNIARQDNGLPALAADEELNAAATAKVQDMFVRQYFAHVSPIGESASNFAEDAGYEYIAIGENLALGNFDDDEALVEAWLESPGHRANILSDGFSEIGIAVATGMFEGEQTWLAVQIFGLPRNACPSVDDFLRVQIESNENQLDQMQSEMTKARAELDTLKGKNRDEYAHAVEQYNLLVAKYNSLLNESKEMIDEYNSQVNAFNFCLNG